MSYEDLETFKLKEAEKISLWYTNDKECNQILVCPNVKTFMVKLCYKLKRFSNVFFQFMPLLRVLDLSRNINLIEVPPGIGKLDALTYLNLSYTRIKELPIELKQLKNLMMLIMESINTITLNIPQGLISSLTSLKLFDMYGTKTSEVEEILLEELESLDGLSEIRMTISSALSFNKLKSSHKLLRCMSHVMFYTWGDVIFLELSSSFFKRARHLTKLDISSCAELKGMKINVEIEGTLPNKISTMEKYFQSLKNVYISCCPKLLDLTCLVHVPFVEYLYIEYCESLNEVVHGDGSVHEIDEKLDIFSRLKRFKLNKLPRLKSIYPYPLLLPSLESIKVYECESLKRLPFDSNTSTNNLKKIKGEISWWNQLEWHEETAKRSYTRYFENHEPEADLTESEQSVAGSSTDDKEEELK